MKKVNDLFRFSPTDLSNFLGCRHATSLDTRRADGELEVPLRHNARLERLAERGLLHETAYLRFLETLGLQIEKLGNFDDTANMSVTIDLMREGVDVIFQASLESGLFAGRSDFLIRVNETSNLGNWSYEVVDTKLSQMTKAGTILQLCLYSDLVANIQGLPPEAAHVVKPGDPFEKETFPLSRYWSYFRLVKRQLQGFIAAQDTNDLYPEPVPHCEVCRWFPVCDRRRRDDDHLSFIAGIQSTQIIEIRRQGVDTLESFAKTETPLNERPLSGSREAYDRIHAQAKLQYKGREQAANLAEFRPVEHPQSEKESLRGFLRLPEPNAGDVFLDFEGNPHAPDGVLEYLFGYVIHGPNGPEYHHDWCLDRRSEKNSFDRFMTFLVERRRQFPDFHVYHYAPYEPAAMKRMAMRHAMHEAVLDEFLRAEKFVDLFGVVRQGLTLSVERYSIKNLEVYYDFQREADLRDVRIGLNEVERSIELGGSANVSQAALDLVQAYNMDDCVSTLHLQSWLEGKRLELIDGGEDVPRPPAKPGNAGDGVEERNAQTAEVFDRLVAELPEVDLSDFQRSKKLMAHLLDYFYRENKTVWWEYFRHLELEDDDLLYEKSAIAGLRFIRQQAPEGRARTPISVYEYPPQEHTVRPGKNLSHRDGRTIGTVISIDYLQRTIEIKKTRETATFHPSSVFVHDFVRPHSLPSALLALGTEIADLYPGNPQIRSARHDLLSRRRPRFHELSLPQSGEPIDLAIRMARDLDHSILAIQGPPGTGKTHVASRMIVALAKQGFRIGITAVSHKVISNLILKAFECDEINSIQFAHQSSSRPEDYPEAITVLRRPADSLTAINKGSVVGGTAFLWSNEMLTQQLDYLFIDEAGQMSLALALAAMRATKNAILLGDPQQLEQPQRAAHPEGAEVAALGHYIGEHATISADRGLFLAETWRLHPYVCKFTSQQFYDSRLNSREHCTRHAIVGEGDLAGAGLRYVPAVHHGNQSRSDKEVEIVCQIVNQLTRSGFQWSDADRRIHPLTYSDILIVAPYNAQVDAIKAALRDQARVGTVDKFQGQEAPVVIYSTATSSAEDAPRGMEFLYDPHRFNVATSRSKCLTILVASPKLFEPSCRTPRQMELANSFCRFAEMATEVIL